MSEKTFKEALTDAQRLVNHRAQQDLHVRGSNLYQAMHYAVSGGKAFRAFLVLESAALFDVPRNRAERAAMAVECIHAYSLVHDDLPCMDDDDLRRGRPTVHKRWNEAVAVLAGDALQTIAFEYLSHRCMGSNAIELVSFLARCAGRSGMVGGQMLDIEAEAASEPLTLDAIERLQYRKTGALIHWSGIAGPMLAGESTKELSTYARKVGRAFQIADDILDVTGDEEKAGKRLQKDAAAGKATFVSLLGLNEAREQARALVAEAIDALSLYDARADHLRDAARFVISREH